VRQRMILGLLSIALATELSSDYAPSLTNSPFNEYAEDYTTNSNFDQVSSDLVLSERVYPDPYLAPDVYPGTDYPNRYRDVLDEYIELYCWYQRIAHSAFRVDFSEFSEFLSKTHPVLLALLNIRIPHGFLHYVDQRRHEIRDYKLVKFIENLSAQYLKTYDLSFTSIYPIIPAFYSQSRFYLLNRMAAYYVFLNPVKIPLILKPVWGFEDHDLDVCISIVIADDHDTYLLDIVVYSWIKQNHAFLHAIIDADDKFDLKFYINAWLEKFRLYTLEQYL
jgi:hypothetical protein